MSGPQEEPTRTDLIPAPVRPLVTPEQAAEDWALYEVLIKSLLTEDDYQVISGKKRKTKSAFRKLAVVFNLSDRILEQERTDRDDDSFFWRIVVEITAPNGRVSTGVAICDSKERKFAHVEHDVYATAHTRAKNRAISDLVAGGAVSAEELEVSKNKSNNESASSKPENTTPVLDEVGIVDALESAGLDTEDLEITIDKGKTVIKPTKYLKGDFDRYNSEMWRFGLTWVKDGKGSRWVGVFFK